MTIANPFAPATKRSARARIALVGPSGSGKTWSALELATGLGGKIAVLDTERGSAALYSDLFKFDVLELTPPYTPQAYIDSINAAAGHGYDVLIIDSLSQAWAGEGGVLEQVDDAKENTKNQFSAWGPATKSQNALINAMLGAPLHLIATMRAKPAYAVEDAGNGKTRIRKLGLEPVQRGGVEHEFTTVLSIGMDHEAEVSVVGKDRSRLFTEPHVLTRADGERLKAWLETGIDTNPTLDDFVASAKDAMARGWAKDAVMKVVGATGASKLSDVPEHMRAGLMAKFAGTPF